MDLRKIDPGDPAVTDAELWGSAYGILYTTKFIVDWKERVPLMRHILEVTGVRSILDVGTNAGWNLRALRDVDQTLTLAGLEINEHTAMSAGAMHLNVYVGDALHAGDFFEGQFDLAITSGVLIHMPPELIEPVMGSVAKTSRKWVVAIEYPSEEEAVTRKWGDVPRCWSRPYGKMYEALGLEIVETGDAWPAYPGCIYWLMRKK